MIPTQQPCSYCGAKAGSSCTGYGLIDGDVHEARYRGTTKASDVVELGRARALLGCPPDMSLLDGVRRIRAEVAELHTQVRRLQEEQRGTHASANE